MFGIFAVVIIAIGVAVSFGGAFAGARGVTDAHIGRRFGYGITGLGLVLLLFASVTKVDAGEVLVPVRFGKPLAPVEQEGVTLIDPFATRFRMPTRTVEISFLGSIDGDDDEGKKEREGLLAIQSLSSEGARVDVDVTVLYHIDPSLAGRVYETVRSEWETILVIPFTRNTIRDCTPGFTFEEARTTHRGEVSLCVLESMQAALSPRGIVIEDVLIRDMKADDQLQAAIDRKLEAQSNAARAQFEQDQRRIDAETVVIEAEARARAILAEAQGQADANRLIAESLTPELVQLRIFETLGNKTVYLMGTDTGILPVLPLEGAQP